MANDRNIGIYYDEKDPYVAEELGSKIPIFIGKTNNTNYKEGTEEEILVNGTRCLKFNSYEEACKPMDKGGIGHIETSPTKSGPSFLVKSLNPVSLSTIANETTNISFYSQIVIDNTLKMTLDEVDLETSDHRTFYAKNITIGESHVLKVTSEGDYSIKPITKEFYITGDQGQYDIYPHRTGTNNLMVKVQDKKGKPITDANVVFQNNYPVPYSTTDKAYVLSGLSNGSNLTVSVDKTQYKKEVVNNVELKADSEPVIITLETSNQVFVNTNEGAEVSLTNSTGSIPLEYDEDSMMYVVESIEWGSYTLNIVKDGFKTISEDITISPEHYVFTRHLLEYGILKLKSKQGITDATVQLVEESGTTYTASFDDNDYVFKNIEPAEYTIQITKDGYNEYTAPITINSGDNGRQIFYLTPVENPNPLLDALYDFFEEGGLKKPGDLGINKVYVIDVGDGSDLDSWRNAFKTSEITAYGDLTVEAYVGIDSIETDTNPDEHVKIDSPSITDGLELATKHVHSILPICQLRDGMYTLTGASDEQLKEHMRIDKHQRLHRMHICEPFKFGKIVGRACVTEYKDEIGRHEFRTIQPGECIQRTPEEELELQKLGITFIHDEKIGANVYTKINLFLSNNYALNPRPTDAEYKKRYIADTVVRAVIADLYPFLKMNEIEKNLLHMQTVVDRRVDYFVEDDAVYKYHPDTNPNGTRFRIGTEKNEPRAIRCEGKIQAVDSIENIDVSAIVSAVSNEIFNEV